MIDRASWCYVCGLVNAQTERLMTRRDVLSLLSVGSDPELRARLRTSLLFADMPAETEQVSEAFAVTVKRVAALSPDSRIGDVFLLSESWEQFRKEAKARIRPSTEGRARAAAREAAAEERFAACWKDDVQDESLKPFAEAARWITEAASGEVAGVGWLDQIADAWEAASLLHAADALESPALREWVATWARLRGALSILRAQRLGWNTGEILACWQAAGFDDPALETLASGEAARYAAALRDLGLPGAEPALAESEPTVLLTRLVDDRIRNLASACNGIPFGPEPVFAFLWALRLEALNLQLALSAAAFGIPEDRLAGELR